MKMLFDLFPVLLFFVAYKLYDIYTATAVAIVASIIQTGSMWIKHRRVETMHVVTMVLIVVMGGATLYLQNELFIKWKPTLVNWAFATAFLVSIWWGKKPLIQRMMGEHVTMPQNIWYRLNTYWIIFFSSVGCINLYVAYNFDTDTWVNFKLFGLMGLTFVFVIAQAVYLSAHIQETE
jgi:intracellular septation protein